MAAEPIQESPSKEIDPKEFIELIQANKKYEEIKFLGKGGMGDVTLAKDIICLRNVAIKKLHSDLLENEESILRFTEEAQIAAQLEHPNIISIYDLSLDDGGMPYYSMKHIQGNDLRDILTEINRYNEVFLKKFPISELLRILLKVCDAMSFACSKGALHRDLKPENIMIGAYGEVLLVDWGLAKTIDSEELYERPSQDAVEKLLQENDQIKTLRKRTSVNLSMNNCLMGTPEYMSPERVFGHANEQTEIYSLGAILYAILSLENLYKEEDIKILIRKLTKGDYRELNSFSDLPHFANGRIPESLISITQKALHIEPSERYKTIADFRKDLEAYLQGYAPKAEDASFSKIIKLMIKRHKKLSITAACLVSIIFFACIFFISQLIQQQNQAEIESKVAIKLEQQTEKSAQKIQEKSTELTEKINELKLSAPIFYQSAYDYLNESNFKKAATTLNYALSLQPDLRKALILKARLFMVDQKFRAATKVYQKLLENNGSKDNNFIWEEMALCKKLNKELENNPETQIATQVYSYLSKKKHINLTIKALEKLKGSINYDQNLLKAWKEKLSVSAIKDIVNKRSEFSISVKNGHFDVTFNSTNLYDLSSLKGMPIAHLSISNAPINNISALQQMPLQTLVIKNCELTSLTSFRRPTLTSLDISNTKVESLLPVINMPLKNLNIANTRISKLTSTFNMPISRLNISNTPIQSLESLRGKVLTSIIAEHTQIKDISALAGMPLDQVNFKNSPIKDISIFKSLPKLTTVNLENTFVDNLEGFINCQKLTRLNVTNCPIRNFKGLENSKLKYFYASNTQVTTVEELKNLPLETLHLSKTNIESLLPIEHKNLKSLHLNNSAFLIPGSLAKFTELTQLFVNECNIRDLSFLKNINLEVFSAHFNRINSTDAFSHMNRLNNLNLTRNPIKDLSGLAGQKLTSLALNSTPIKDITALGEMPLEYLAITECKKIDSLKPLEKLKKIIYLKVPSQRQDYHYLKDLKSLRDLSDNWQFMTPKEFWKKYPLKD